MRLPPPRGPVTDLLVGVLAGTPDGDDPRLDQLHRAAGHAGGEDPCADEDLQLALTLLYELHYRGLDGVDERWEWSPRLLQARASLEQAFERALHEAVRVPDLDLPVDEAVAEVIAGAGGPRLSSYVQRSADVDQVRELLVHRSIYQLKEADPHSWVIPRLGGRAKAALVEIQADEYGNGRFEDMHATLFAQTLRELGVDDRYGVHLPVVPGVTLATSNLISLFGLHRRWRGALVGHLTAFESTSAVPSRRYGNGLRRLGFPETATRFYDVHVTADALHEQLAGVELCGSLVAAEPALYRDVLFGVAACLEVENRWAGHLLESWTAGRTSLLAPAPRPAAATALAG